MEVIDRAALQRKNQARLKHGRHVHIQHTARVDHKLTCTNDCGIARHGVGGWSKQAETENRIQINIYQATVDIAWVIEDQLTITNLDVTG